MRVIVTRPAREAAQWVQELSQQGVRAQALPLIQVGPVPELAPLQAAWRQLPAFAAVMFVSANAAEQFFAAKPASASTSAFTAEGALQPRAWATGPGTTAALLRAGVAPAVLDAPPADAAQFDSGALWVRVSHQVQAGSRVLIVRGRDAVALDATGAADTVAPDAAGVGRDWLAQRLQQAGARVEWVVAYQRTAPVWLAPERSLAQQAASDGSVWLFSSTQAVTHLLALLPGQAWTAARAVATHARIAQALRNAGFGRVTESRPTLRDVMASIESMP
jgi:uroporphyrinogen-III synthase